MEHDKKVAKQKALSIFSRFYSLIKKHTKLSIVAGIVVLLILFFAGKSLFAQNKAPQYQTDQVTKGTLVVSLSESGSIASSNRQPVVTQASGVVSEVDVANGDSVTAGQTIAKIDLDTTGQQKQAQAYASYLSAQNALASAQSDLNTLQATLFKTNQAFLQDRGVANPTDQQKADPVYIQENDAWMAAESNYKNQQNVISQAQASLTNASLSYQQSSGVITAPISGTVTDLTLAPGMQISNSSSSTTSTNTSSSIASIQTTGNPVVSVTLSEMDAAKVKVGQKATVTLDALPNQTFTGKVMGINTSGSVSSGVTTYPAIILLDSPNDSILPNMSATANIILDVKPDVLLVPTSAVTTSGGVSTVRVMQNGKVTPVEVTTGESSDTQTEIASGLSEGQTVVTSVTLPTTTNATSSPFSTLGGTRGFGGGAGGGGAVFFRGGGGGGRGN